MATIALLWAAVISRLQIEWSTNPQYSYGWTVPFCAAALFWLRWEEAPEAERPHHRAFAILLVFVCAAMLLPVRWLLEANPDWRLLDWALAGSAVTITLSAIYLAGGFAWLRSFAFSVLFFLVAVPWPMRLEQHVIQGLMRADTAINVELLNFIGIPAVQLGNVIEVSTGMAGIDEACTGVRSLQATLMVSLFLGAFYRFTAGRRILLVVAGALIAFACNVVRTAILVSLQAKQGSAALQRWHDPAGYSILLICLFALWCLSLFLSRGQTLPPPRTRGVSQSFRIPRFALALLALLVVSAEAGTQLWYSVQEKRVAPAPRWQLDWSAMHEAKDLPIAQGAADLLRFDEGRAVAWQDNQARTWNLFFFRWLPGHTAALSVKVHRPEICLPASGFVSLGEPRSELIQINGIALPTRAYRFSDNGQPVYVYYCYWDGSVFRDTQEMIEEDWTPRGRLHRALAGRRDRGAQTVEVAIWGATDEATADAALKDQLEGCLRLAN